MTSGGILRNTLRCLPLGALKADVAVEGSSVMLPCGDAVPDTGSVTVVGIPSTAD
jgi:hypothetical protein